MLTLETCKKEWEETGRYGSQEERLQRGALWEPYYTFIAEKQLAAPIEKNEESDFIRELLQKEGVLKDGDDVLDIGAGTGRFSLAFAQNCRSVTALDSNAASLRVIEAHAAARGLSGIDTVPLPWERFDGKNASFDLVFSSMCPAVCSVDELLRMERLSRRSCCLIAVCRGSYEKVRQELMRMLPIKKISGMTTEALQYYNALYLMGRSVNVKTLSRHYEYEQTEEGLLATYPMYFRIFGVDEDTSVRVIKEYCAEHAVNGMIPDECQMNYAVLWWDKDALIVPDVDIADKNNIIQEEITMNEKETILEAMKKAGEPLNAGRIAELTGLDRKAVDKAMAEMRKDGSIVSPVRCKWEPATK